METVVKQFGVNPILLLAQIINFLILLYILKRFMYKPILKIMEDRRARIEDSLKNADEIERRLQKINDEREQKIREALDEAKGIIKDAHKTSEEIMMDARAKGEQQIQVLIKKAQDQLGRERESLHQEIRQEVAQMIVVGLKKVVGKVLTSKDQKQLVKDSIKGL